jgi:hypothetical protein
MQMVSEELAATLDSEGNVVMIEDKQILPPKPQTVEEMQYELFKELKPYEEKLSQKINNPEEHAEFAKLYKMVNKKRNPGWDSHENQETAETFMTLEFGLEPNIFSKYLVGITDFGRFRGDNLKWADGTDGCTYIVKSYMSERDNIMKLYMDNKIDGLISIDSKDEEDYKKYGCGYINLNNVV